MNPLKAVTDVLAAPFRKSSSRQLLTKTENTSHVVLLGTGDSGKSTIFKHLKIKFGKENDHEHFFTTEENRKIIQRQIRAILIESMRLLLQYYYSQVQQTTLSKENDERAQKLLGLSQLELLKNDWPVEQLEIIRHDLRALWREECLKNLIKQIPPFLPTCLVTLVNTKVQLPTQPILECAEHYFNDINRIFLPEFIPTREDFLRCRFITTGNTKTSLKVETHDEVSLIDLYDSGGHRSERRKWTDILETNERMVLLYVVNLAEYDLVLREDKSVNRMKESLQVCKEIQERVQKSNGQMRIMLVLNKRDIFINKIVQAPHSLRSCFPDYNPPSLTPSASESSPSPSPSPSTPSGDTTPRQKPTNFELVNHAVGFIANKFGFEEPVVINALEDNEVEGLMKWILSNMSEQKPAPLIIPLSALTSPTTSSDFGGGVGLLGLGAHINKSARGSGGKNKSSTVVLNVNSKKSALSSSFSSITGATTTENKESKDQYKIIKKIGEGAQGGVFIVENTDNMVEKQILIMKRLKLSGVKELNDSFAEVKSLFELKNSKTNHIAAILDFYVDNAESDNYVLCLILEYCKGGDLSSVLKTHRKKAKSTSSKQILPEHQVFDWFKQMCDGLKVVHEHGLIHRDLKPENIFFAAEDCKQIKIGDFGLTCVINSRKQSKNSVGTEEYMSPELYEGKDCTQAVDIWALGCILLELLTLETKNIREVLQEDAFYIDKKLSQLKSAFSDELLMIVRRCLQVEASKRPSFKDNSMQSLLLNVKC